VRPDGSPRSAQSGPARRTGRMFVASQDETGQHQHEPWVYPHTFEADPAAVDARKELETGTGDPEPLQEQMSRLYWQRHSDHAAEWLKDNPGASVQLRDKAERHGAAARRNVRNVGRPPRPRLEFLEQEFSETGNLLYPLEAATWIFNGLIPSTNTDLFAPTEVPFWIVQALAPFFMRLHHLGLPGHEKPSKANIIEALGLTSQGYSAYTARARRQRDQAGARLAEELQQDKQTKIVARRIAFPNIDDPGQRRRAAKRGATR
jgi:hypothetical protein